MLSLSSLSVVGFAGPTLLPATGRGAVSMRAEGEIGVTPPLGVYDPLGLLETPVVYPRRDYRRYVELEIKHGRIAMLATVGVITTEAGFRWPGYLSKSLDIKFADMPGEERPLQQAWLGVGLGDPEAAFAQLCHTRGVGPHPMGMAVFWPARPPMRAPAGARVGGRPSLAGEVILCPLSPLQRRAGGCFDSYNAVPALGWLQIVGFIIFLELAYGATDPSKDAGDIGGVSWVR